MSDYSTINATDLLSLAAHDEGARAEAIRRMRPAERPSIRCSAEAAELFARKVKGRVERFAVVSLDARNRPIGVDVVAQGTANTCAVHPRDVFGCAVRRNAIAVILCHNHPSGSPAPSPEDEALTARLVEAGKLLGVQVLDHVIVGDPDYASFRDLGVLK